MTRTLKRLWARYALILSVLTQPLAAVAAEPVETAPEIAAPVAQVEAAIRHLMTLDPHARVMTDAPYRADVAAALVGAGEAHGVPALLLTAVAFRESSFDHAATGARGELGLTQIMPRWRNVLGCDLTTIGGQVDCSARMLAQYHRTCKTWPGALTLYATGKGCATGPKTTSKIASRITLWQRLEAL
jgi:hypothetical protein